MNPVLKKKLSILIHLAGIDGDFAKVEKSFIKDICDRNEVSNHEFEELLRNPEPIGSLGALSYAKVVEYMSDSLSLMIVDGKIRQSEVILCEDIGLRLGFQKSSIDQAIVQLRDNIERPMGNITTIVEAMPHPSKG